MRPGRKTRFVPVGAAGFEILHRELSLTPESEKHRTGNQNRGRPRMHHFRDLLFPQPATWTGVVAGRVADGGIPDGTCDDGMPRATSGHIACRNRFRRMRFSPPSARAGGHGANVRRGSSDAPLFPHVHAASCVLDGSGQQRCQQATLDEGANSNGQLCVANA